MELCAPAETSSEMSIGMQDSIFGDPSHVEIWDKLSLRDSDEECAESETE
jgi:hypothetical protein